MNPARWTLRCEWCSSEWFCVWRGTLGTKPLVRYPACKRRVRYAWCKTPCSTKSCIYHCSLKLPVELNGLTTLRAAVWMAVCVVKAAQAGAWITELTFKGKICFKTFFNNAQRSGMGKKHMEITLYTFYAFFEHLSRFYNPGNILNEKPILFYTSLPFTASWNFNGCDLSN